MDIYLQMLQLNSIVDLLILISLILISLTISIKFSFTQNFSNIWPYWYASHNILHLLLLITFSILLTASTALFGILKHFAVFSISYLTISSIIIESFTFLKISFLVFLILFFFCFVSFQIV